MSRLDEIRERVEDRYLAYGSLHDRREDEIIFPDMRHLISLVDDLAGALVALRAHHSYQIGYWQAPRSLLDSSEMKQAKAALKRMEE